jgi:hypothetical protein
VCTETQCELIFDNFELLYESLTIHLKQTITADFKKVEKDLCLVLRVLQTDQSREHQEKASDVGFTQMQSEENGRMYGETPDSRRDTLTLFCSWVYTVASLLNHLNFTSTALG